VASREDARDHARARRGVGAVGERVKDARSRVTVGAERGGAMSARADKDVDAEDGVKREGIDAERAVEVDQSVARGSGGSSSQTRTEGTKEEDLLPRTEKRPPSAPRWSSAKRKKSGKASDKPWYCCSCKQSLAPKDFDPGLETCRVCLAKRRAKDRAKKRLRGLQLKHHLLSADEKDVAAFLLGVYHPALGRGALDRTPESPGSAQHTLDSTQRHCQASVEVNAFVDDFQNFLEGQPEVEAVQLIRTFLGVDEHGHKLPPVDKSAFTKKMTKSKYSFGGAVEVEARKELEFKLDMVYKKYSSMLTRVDDQTWVRFEGSEETQTGKSAITQATTQEPVRYSEPIHFAEQDGFHGDNAGVIDDIYSSMLNGADPTVNHFLYEFLFSTDSTDSDVPHLSSEHESVPAQSDSAFLEEVGEVEYKGDLQTFDERLDGDAYAFKGSLVMGWIGRARGENRELLHTDNGILPTNMRPQALSRGGLLFDARNPDLLVPLDETEDLHGFAPELEVYPVIDSSSPEPPVINIPPNAFSGELGVRALHNGHSIDCDVHQKSDGSTDIVLMPNGRDRRNLSPVVILGAVHLQCYVQKGVAKMLPIGSNIPILMIPSRAHVDEIKRGIDEILHSKGPMETRQFLLSLAHVLQHGDPSTAKFKFVLEMAYILRLTKTLKLLERLSLLAKSSSEEETTAFESRAHAFAEAGRVPEKVFFAVTMLGRPLLCLFAGLLRTYWSYTDGNYYHYYRSLALFIIAAALTGARPTTRVELKTCAFSILFSVAHLLKVLTHPSAQRQASSYVTGLTITYALSVLHAVGSNLSMLFSVAIPHMVFAALGFSPSFVQKRMIHNLPTVLDAHSQVMLTVHAAVAHALFSIVIPILLARFTRRCLTPTATHTLKDKRK